MNGTPRRPHSNEGGALKAAAIFAITLMMAQMQVYSQGHIAPCNGSSSHQVGGGICYGYATSRAAGKDSGDAVCDARTFIQDAINTTYFNSISDSNLTGIADGDIVKFAAHAAFLSSKNSSDIGQSIVEQYSTIRSKVEKGKTLNSLINEFGPWTGYYRRKPISITVRNGFSGGTVGIGGDIVSAGSHLVNWWNALSLKAVDRQDVLDQSNNSYYVRVFQNWTIPDDQRSSDSIDVIARVGDVYTANFLKEFNITVSNSSSGTTGGEVKVGGVQYSAPKYTAIVENTPPESLQIEAVYYQYYNQVTYSFKYWTNNKTADTIRTSSATVGPMDHTTYTAAFRANPWNPPDVAVGGDFYSPVQVTWTEHPDSHVVQYRLWRMIKPYNQNQQAPVHIATVNRGTTSFEDGDFLVLPSYTNYLLSYSVESVYSSDGEITFSGTDYHQLFGGLAEKRQPGSGISNSAIPQEVSLQSYPNPFNPITVLSYQLPATCQVLVQVFDLVGHEVVTLVREEKEAGFYATSFNGGGLPSGIYVARLSVNGPNLKSTVMTVKMQLIK